LAKKYKEIYGVDFLLKSLMLLKDEISNLQFSNIKIFCADLTNIIFPSKYFDKIMLVDVLQNVLAHQLRLRTINELYKFSSVQSSKMKSLPSCT